MKIPLIFLKCIPFVIVIEILILFSIPCICISIFSKQTANLKPADKSTEMKKLTYDFIKPPDHLKAVKMERDGHLNKDFRKEILLGNIMKNETEDEKLLTSVHKK